MQYYAIIIGSNLELDFFTLDTLHMKSEFCVLYLDYLSFGGDVDTLRDDLQTALCLDSLGLSLNTSKLEIIAHNTTTYDILVSSIPNYHYVHPSSASLLGSPLGDLDCLYFHSCYFQLLGTIYGLLLLMTLLFYYGICSLFPSSCTYFGLLQVFYHLFWVSMISVFVLLLVTSPTCLSITDAAWHQASLPVWAGGLGFRSAVQLAPSAFLASAMAATPIFQSILHCSTTVIPGIDSALSHWSSGIPAVPPCGDDACLQRSWDSPHMDSTLRSLFEVDHTPTKARLYSVSTPESGAWLNALPLSAMGLRMDDATVRIAVGLRLGLPLCCPHSCRHCDSFVDVHATHGLHCKQSEGRHFRHSCINDILKRAFVAAGLPCRLEPSGLIGAECRRPNGVTMVPWSVGKCFCWDFTCPDTFVPSYIDIASTAAGSVVACGFG